MTKLFTQDGFKKLQDELEFRKGALRQEIAAAIKEAKEQGDLSENAEYSSARQRQSENETRVAELEGLFKEAEIAKKSSVGMVQMGSIVTVTMGDRKIVYTIVGSNEVDPSQGKISNESPLGKAFFGHKAGDKVMAETPTGRKEFTIIEIG
jgi:transcription elongation factor GreA